MLNDMPEMTEYLQNKKAHKGNKITVKKSSKYRIANIYVNVNEPPVITDFVEYAKTLSDGQILCHIHEAREEGFNYMAEKLENLLLERKI